VGQGFLIVEASRLHSDTPHSVGLLWTSDWLVTETSTWQHTTLTRDIHPCPGGIRTRNPSKRTGAGLRHRPRGNCDRRSVIIHYCTKFEEQISNRSVVLPTSRICPDAVLIPLLTGGNILNGLSLIYIAFKSAIYLNSWCRCFEHSLLLSRLSCPNVHCFFTKFHYWTPFLSSPTPSTIPVSSSLMYPSSCCSVIHVTSSPISD